MEAVSVKPLSMHAWLQEIFMIKHFAIGPFQKKAAGKPQPQAWSIPAVSGAAAPPSSLRTQPLSSRPGLRFDSTIKPASAGRPDRLHDSGAQLATSSRSSSLGHTGPSEDAVLSDATNLLLGHTDIQRRKHTPDVEALKVLSTNTQSWELQQASLCRNLV
jgi:hypothetical protein